MNKYEQVPDSPHASSESGDFTATISVEPAPKQVQYILLTAQSSFELERKVCTFLESETELWACQGGPFVTQRGATMFYQAIVLQGQRMVLPSTFAQSFRGVDAPTAATELNKFIDALNRSPAGKAAADLREAREKKGKSK